MKQNDLIRIWVRSIFFQEQRDRQGAGNIFIKKIEMNDRLKYHNFFQKGPDGFEKLLRLVVPLISKSDVGSLLDPK